MPYQYNGMIILSIHNKAKIFLTKGLLLKTISMKDDNGERKDQKVVLHYVLQKLKVVMLICEVVLVFITVCIQRSFTRYECSN